MQNNSDTDTLERPEETKFVPLAAVAQNKLIQSDGVIVKGYAVPAGVKLYTKTYPKEHVTILAFGSVFVKHSDNWTKYVGPAHVIFPANTRLPVIVETDSVRYCVHVTDETDPDILNKLY